MGKTARISPHSTIDGKRYHAGDIDPCENPLRSQNESG
jgi:hypothetical protein